MDYLSNFEKLIKFLNLFLVNPIDFDFFLLQEFIRIYHWSLLSIIWFLIPRFFSWNVLLFCTLKMDLEVLKWNFCELKVYLFNRVFLNIHFWWIKKWRKAKLRNFFIKSPRPYLVNNFLPDRRSIELLITNRMTIIKH